MPGFGVIAPQAEARGQTTWLTPGTYSFVVPSGCETICAVGVGGGAAGGASLENDHSGNGGNGAGLAYSNDIAVTPGETLTVVVGPGGLGVDDNNQAARPGSPTRLHRSGTDLLLAKGGNTSTTQVGDVVHVGGNGATNYDVVPGGGGAAGYSGSGGNGRAFPSTAGYPGAGGGGAGGCYAAGGGGVGLWGEGASGTGQTEGPGHGGSLGEDGYRPGGGGRCGGGGGGGGWDGVTQAGFDGGNGGLRIIWGSGRAFPSTRTADE